ncbi:unnamed protein product [Camellia sinensis]
MKSAYSPIFKGINFTTSLRFKHWAHRMGNKSSLRRLRNIYVDLILPWSWMNGCLPVDDDLTQLNHPLHLMRREKNKVLKGLVDNMKNVKERLLGQMASQVQKLENSKEDKSEDFERIVR